MSAAPENMVEPGKSEVQVELVDLSPPSPPHKRKQLEDEVDDDVEEWDTETMFVDMRVRDPKRARLDSGDEDEDDEDDPTSEIDVHVPEDETEHHWQHPIPLPHLEQPLAQLQLAQTLLKHQRRERQEDALEMCQAHYGALFERMHGLRVRIMFAKRVIAAVRVV